MDKLQKSQWAKLFLIAFLIILTPFISTWMRTPYLYLLLNILIIAVSAESGLLTTFSMHQQSKKTTSVAAPTAPAPVIAAATVDTTPRAVEGGEQSGGGDGGHEKSSGWGDVKAVIRMRKVKKCPSMPSLFFIEGGEEEEEEEMEEEEDDVMKEEEGELPSSQELFAKAEIFIGNFYRKLKIQREESWKRIHGFYHSSAF